MLYLDIKISKPDLAMISSWQTFEYKGSYFVQRKSVKITNIMFKPLPCHWDSRYHCKLRFTGFSCHAEGLAKGC